MTTDADDLNFLISEDRPNNDVHLDEAMDFDIAENIVPDPAQETPPITQSASIALPKDKFAAFMSILKMLKYSCQDLYIVNGKIRQVNSKKSMFFDIDLTSILGNANLIINGIAGKFDTIDILKRQGVDVMLDISDTGYDFSDAISRVHHKKPMEAYLEQVRVTEQQIQERAAVDYNRRIFKYTWQKRVLDRIINYAKTLATPVLRIECNGSEICCKAMSLDNASTTQVTVLVLQDEVDDTSINGLVVPFPCMCFVNFIQGGIVEIESELYHRIDDTRPSATLKLTGSLPIGGTDLSIPITIYACGGFSPINEVTGGSNF